MRLDRAVMGRAAFVAACVGTVVAPVHALSRYATEDGKEDLELPGVRFWAEPAAERLSVLLDWSDADTVYLTYGKVWFPVLLATTVCAFLVQRQRDPGGLERWGWRIALVGYALLTASVLGDYWTPYLEESFMFLGMPGLLFSLLGSGVLGAALLRSDYRPLATSWLLVAWLPLLLLLSSLVALGAAILPLVWAWVLTGRALARSEPAAAPARSSVGA